MRLTSWGLGPFALALSLTTALAGEIVLNSDQSDPAPKKAMERLIADFEKANPDVKVKWNNFDHEGYKAAINNFLKANPPDVAAWYAGNRMAPQVKAGLFEDVTDVWQKNGLDETLKSAAPVDDDRRQEMGRALHLLSVGHLLSRRHLQGRTASSRRRPGPNSWRPAQS